MVKNTGRFQLLRQLMADGTEFIFGNPGTSEQSLLDALRDGEFKSLKYVMALNEGSVVAMGDAYARAKQKPAIVQLHSYAGLANGLGMMKYAHRGYAPMVVVAGEAGLAYEALDGQMSADLISIARPFVKSDHNGPCAWRIVHPGSVLRLLRRAYKTAATPPMGPVFLALPMDVLEAVNTEEVIPTSLVRTAVVPDDETLKRAAVLLVAAKSPLILMGDGIAASGAQDELAKVAELLGASVCGANCSEVNIAASHPLFQALGHMFGKDSKPIISAADAVLICGTTVLPEVFPSLEGVFAPGAVVVQFDLNATEIEKNFPVTLAALADPKPTLARLGQVLEKLMSPEQKNAASSRIREAASRRDQKRNKELERDTALVGRETLHASQFFKALGQRPEIADAVIFDEALTTSPDLCRYLVQPQDKVGRYYQTRAGMLGTGLPGTVGLKVAYPDRTVIGFGGDGGTISTIQALATAARYKLGCKFVVCNNRSYRILKYNLKEYREEERLPANDPYPDSFDLAAQNLRFDLLAQGQGVKAERVENATQIEPAIERMLKDKNEPYLIDLVIGGEL
jgi:thiamine pyrophosphate-dependent acetolactate synthase large subunit-like protein